MQCAHSYFDWLSELPAIDVRFPRNKTVLEGEQFTLRCLLLGNKNNFNVTWMKKSGNERSFPVAGQNLTVNATRLDTGAYICEVTNGVEAIVSPIAYVTVCCKCIDQGFQLTEPSQGLFLNIKSAKIFPFAVGVIITRS